MWNDLSYPWQRSIELGWEAYKGNTFPIGAVITNAQGMIISEGRNHIYDQNSDHPLAGTYMAHAEVSSMVSLKAKDHPDIKSYTLYTTMEPCPMCFGTMVMMNIKNLKYGARDSYCGATDIFDSHYYVSKKKLNITHRGGDIEVYQLVLQTAFEYTSENYSAKIFEAWNIENEKSVLLGKVLSHERYFQKAARVGKSVDRIYDEVLERYGN